ncbi:hypothetical protein V8G54_036663 [Vigna mungo]|uniref:Uncharacterized protein n=1 Tax=Vigna mungo TaxID=3915 RepID=A0AAQ3MH73_VIGMU
MSASRFALYGIGTAIFRAHRTAPVTVRSSFIFSKPVPFTPPQFLRRTSPSSAAAETLPSVDHRLSELVSSVPRLNAKGYLSKPYSSAAAKTLSYVYHPWSEWVSFVDCLIAKGYLSKPSSSDYTVNLYTDKNSLEDACLRFGRDRPDLLMSVRLFYVSSGRMVVSKTGNAAMREGDSVGKGEIAMREGDSVGKGYICRAWVQNNSHKSLPRREMEAVVKERFSDCLPEVLNSAKRLRAYLQLHDREVWEYCERRFLYPGGHVDFENEAGPVDIVRILLYYALDSLVPFKRPGREVIESSARELLYKIELHEYIHDSGVFDLDRQSERDRWTGLDGRIDEIVSDRQIYWSDGNRQTDRMVGMDEMIGMDELVYLVELTSITGMAETDKMIGMDELINLIELLLPGKLKSTTPRNALAVPPHRGEFDRTYRSPNWKWRNNRELLTSENGENDRFKRKPLVQRARNTFKSNFYRFSEEKILREGRENFRRKATDITLSTDLPMVWVLISRSVVLSFDVLGLDVGH